MKTYKRILIIGAGSIGRRHLNNLITLGYKNIALCDPFINEIKNLSPGLAKFTEIGSALKSYNPSVCFVCSPTNLHIMHLKQCLKHDTHVFVEKPLSHSMRGIDEVTDLSKDKNKKVMVGCNWRFNKTFKSLKQLLQKKQFGDVISALAEVKYFLPDARSGIDWRKIYAVKKNGGGVTLDSGSHVLNYMENLLGRIDTATIFRSQLHPLNTGVDESSTIFLSHKNGFTTQVYLDFISKDPTHVVQVNTTQGTLKADLRTNEIFFRNNSKTKRVFRKREDFNQMYIEEVRHFFSALEGEVKISQTLEEASRIVRFLTN